MIRPVQITFHNLDSSEALEAVIRARTGDLETYYPRIVGCRVLVDLPHKHKGPQASTVTLLGRHHYVP